jgi:hypothetical protein
VAKKTYKNNVLPFPGKPPVKPEYRPDPRNGMVTVHQSYKTIYINDEPTSGPDGFTFVWMRGNGDPGDEGNHFDTREQAERAALEYAMQRNAVYSS